jgi:glycosyl transferase family 25
MKKNNYLIFILLIISLVFLLYLLYLLYLSLNKNDKNNLFGGVFYINLDHRKDRRDQIESELNKMDLKYERYNAIKHKIGIIGCGLSHLNVLKEAKRRNLKNVLIFEDDFQFIVDKKTFWEKMNNFFNKNIDYDVLLISYNMKNSEPYDDELLKVLDSQTASGYLVNNKFYDKLIENLEEGNKLLQKTNNPPEYANDIYWKRLQPKNNWYAFKERLGIQRESYSDNENKIVNYELFTNYVR